MRVAFVDLASHRGLLALCDARSVRAQRIVDGRIGDDALIPAVDDLLREAMWEMTSFTHIACVIGPGGFTSLRIAVAFSNALAWLLHVPVTGIHLSDLYAARLSHIPHSTFHSPAVWLHSTKATELFVRTLSQSHSPRERARERGGGQPTVSHFPSTPSLCPLSSVLCPLRYIGELLPAHEEAIRAHGGTPISLQSIVDILPAFLVAQRYTAPPLSPWYGRPA